MTTTLQLPDDDLDVMLDALSMAERRCDELADQLDDRGIRAATKAVAKQYGDLRRRLKDRLLGAHVHRGPSPRVVDLTTGADDASSRQGRAAA